MPFPAPSRRSQHRRRVSLRFSSDDFWLNLHHFLYVLGRAQLGTPDASRAAVVEAPREADEGRARLTEGEQKTWAAAVMEYAVGFSRKDLLFDDPLPATTLAIAAAGDAPSLANVGVDPQTRLVLEISAPVYRKAWWRAHRAANRVWRSSMESLLEQHGATLVAFATRAYELPWPSGGYIVHASSYANWGGSYSTSGGLIMMSTRDRSMQGLYGLELLFHEAMHQWDAAVLTTLQTQARSVNLSVPRDLTHAMIFFTSGYAVQQIAPGHVPTADALNV